MKHWFALAPAILLLGCGSRTESFVMPDQVTDFATLYKSNCSGCHGDDGQMGAARPLNDPLFLAVIGKQTLREVIANGVPKHAMPAFAQSAGGGLTDQQIAILADQIVARWSRPKDFDGLALPPYRSELGDPEAGRVVFGTHCVGCHGQDGTGGAKAGSAVDPSFLALASDQSLRTTVIAGRSDLGSPDYRNHDHPMKPQEISDVVAWLSSHRAMPVNVTQRGTKLP
jgi:mono/diheme cytochrome c family protein